MSNKQTPVTTDPRAWLAAKGTEALVDCCSDQATTIGQMNREISNLRALVTRLTNVAQDLAGGTSDPGTEALAAIHCGRNFIYG